MCVFLYYLKISKSSLKVYSKNSIANAIKERSWRILNAFVHRLQEVTSNHVQYNARAERISLFSLNIFFILSREIFLSRLFLPQKEPLTLRVAIKKPHLSFHTILFLREKNSSIRNLSIASLMSRGSCCRLFRAVRKDVIQDVRHWRICRASCVNA